MRANKNLGLEPEEGRLVGEHFGCHGPEGAVLDDLDFSERPCDDDLDLK